MFVYFSSPACSLNAREKYFWHVWYIILIPFKYQIHVTPIIREFVQTNTSPPYTYDPTRRSNKGCVNDRYNTLMWKAETNLSLDALMF